MNIKQLRPGLLPIIALVVVAVWALAAIGMLTGTLFAARSIDQDVVAINTTYPEVEQDLRSIPLAEETGRIAEEINQAVKPVGPQFTQIVDAVRSIDASVATIGGNVATINTSVHEINTSVHSINGTVGQIDAGLTAVGKDVAEINDSAHGIKSKFDQILGGAADIDDRLAKADHQVEKVIDGVVGIRGDLDKVLNVLVPDIIKNAAAIAGSPVLNLDAAKLPGPLLDSLLGLIAGGPAPVQAPVALDESLPVAQPAPVEPQEALPVEGVPVPSVEDPVDDGLLAPLTKWLN